MQVKPAASESMSALNGDRLPVAQKAYKTSSHGSQGYILGSRLASRILAKELKQTLYSNVNTAHVSPGITLDSAHRYFYA